MDERDCKIIFINDDGRTIEVNIKEQIESNDFVLSFNFGEEGSDYHEGGLHSLLMLELFKNFI